MNATTTMLYIMPDSNIKIFYEEHTTYNKGDSGLDLFSPEEVTINAGEVKKIDLGITCSMSDIDTSTGNVKNVSYYLYARSSIINTPLMLANNVGIIDSGYRGKIIMALRNVGTNPYTIKRGDRLVQICSRTLEPFDFTIVDSLSETTRGSGGFGSTGK